MKSVLTFALATAIAVLSVATGHAQSPKESSSYERRAFAAFETALWDSFPVLRQAVDETGYLYGDDPGSEGSAGSYGQHSPGGGVDTQPIKEPIDISYDVFAVGSIGHIHFRIGGVDMLFTFNYGVGSNAQTGRILSWANAVASELNLSSADRRRLNQKVMDAIGEAIEKGILRDERSRRMRKAMKEMNKIRELILDESYGSEPELPLE